MVAACSRALGGASAPRCWFAGFAALDRQHQSKAFGLMWAFVASVSVHDAALVVLNSEAIMDFEQNPLGRWLIEVGAGSVWLFVAVKLLGTCVVCGLLASIHELSRVKGLLVAASLACFQVGLLAYLYTH